MLALSDAVWLDIDHRNPAALASGVQFIQTYNEKVATFDTLASELSQMIQQFTHVRLEGEASDVQKAGALNERTVHELDHATPHSLNEDFTFKRPYGFTFNGRTFTDIATWRRMYEVFCRQLADLDPVRFASLPDNRAFLRPINGRHAFVRSPQELRGPSHNSGIYGEMWYSANGLRDNMIRLLGAFGMKVDDVTIYPRQDRDAELSYVE